MCFSIGLSAQTGDTLTIEQAVQMAKQNHPSMRAAELGVKQQKKLRKSAFGLDKTIVSYSSGQLNSSIIDYQWQITQKFKFPTTYISQSKLQGEKLELSRRALTVTEMDLERNVRKAWWQLAYSQEQLQVLTELADIYKNFADAAEKKYNVGETNLLEKTSAVGHYQ